MPIKNMDQSFLDMKAAIAFKLKKSRLDKKLTLRHVEAQTGVNNAIISQMENNKYGFDSFNKLSKLAKFYGLDMNTIHEVIQ